jgi:hypothetical protein
MESSINAPLKNLDLRSISGYSFAFIILAVLTMLVLFLRKKLKSYYNQRQRLIDMSESYERKRTCRNDLRVNKSELINKL